MTCASCVGRVERGLGGLDGVKECRVNLATETATVLYDDERHRARSVRDQGRRARATRCPSTSRATSTTTRTTIPTRLRCCPRLIVAAVLSVPVVLISMVPALMVDGWQWIALVLSTPVIFWAGWPFHRATLVNLRHGAVTMDTLVSLGTTAAWLWSVVALVFLDASASGMESMTGAPAATRTSTSRPRR